jgi:3'-phosphoadenosine 5'-phosphosulfate sulfotransferase (PAPS reductase)/FAD synthetase
VLECEGDDGDDDLLHLAQDLRRALDGGYNLQSAMSTGSRKTESEERTTYRPNSLGNTHSSVRLILVARGQQRIQARLTVVGIVRGQTFLDQTQVRVALMRKSVISNGSK